MKRLVGVSLAIALLGGLTFSHNVLSAPRQDGSVTICHVTGNNGAIVVQVDKKSAPAHKAHGDCVVAATSTVGSSCTPKLKADGGDCTGEL